MSARPRPIRRSLVSAALVLVGSLHALAPAGSAQSCIQPMPDGCPLPLDAPVEAALGESGGAHLWWLTVPDGTIDLQLTLSRLAADYRLSVYGPDRTLLGASDREGASEQSIVLRTDAAGEYAVLVDSPNGRFSPEPYLLAVTATSSGGEAPGPPSTPAAVGPSSPPAEPSPVTIVVVLTQEPALEQFPSPSGFIAPTMTAPTITVPSQGSSRSTYIGARTRQVLPFDPFGPFRQCQDFGSWAVAQDFFEAAGGPGGDRHGLDPDRDGIACNELRERERPAAPTGFAAVYDPVGTSIRLTWQDRSTNELGYKIEVQIQPVTSAVGRIQQVPANSTTATVSGLTPTTYYCYFVWAYTEWMESERAALCDSQVPVAPAGLTGAYDAGGTMMRLSWRDRSDNEQGFKIDVQAITGAVIRTLTVPANSTTATITGLAPSTAHCFHVLAFNQSGESERTRFCE